MSTNLLILQGNTTSDVAFSTAGNGKPMARFTIATDRFYTNQHQERCKKTSFMPVIIYGDYAVRMRDYVGKGSKILVEGHLDNNNWTDSNGINHYDLQIVVERIDFIATKLPANAQQQPQPNTQQGFKPKAIAGTGDNFDSDLPF